MKKIWKIAAVVLALALMLPLTACGDEELGKDKAVEALNAALEKSLGLEAYSLEAESEINDDNKGLKTTQTISLKVSGGKAVCGFEEKEAGNAAGTETTPGTEKFYYYTGDGWTYVNNLGEARKSKQQPADDNDNISIIDGSLIISDGFEYFEDRAVKNKAGMYSYGLLKKLFTPANLASLNGEQISGVKRSNGTYKVEIEPNENRKYVVEINVNGCISAYKYTFSSGNISISTVGIYSFVALVLNFPTDLNTYGAGRQE